jgi:hypothetical protein
MHAPDGTWVSGGPEVPVPQLKPETVRVFLAEDSPSKRDAVIASLETYGLATGLVMAENYREAEVFIEAQIPGQLTANVFLLDGELDEEHMDDNSQGRILAGKLFDKYHTGVAQVVSSAIERLKEGNLTSEEISLILTSGAIHRVAAQRLRTEALLVGISRTFEGELDEPAQISLTPYEEVGKVVFERVIPEPLRNRIAKDKRREADRERSRASRTSE